MVAVGGGGVGVIWHRPKAYGAISSPKSSSLLLRNGVGSLCESSITTVGVASPPDDRRGWGNGKPIGTASNFMAATLSNLVVNFFPPS